MVFNWSSRKILRKVASRAKYKTLFACKALYGRSVYRVTVPFESVLIGTQCGKRLEHWVEQTGDYGRVSTRLSHSPYVAFLNDLKRKPEVLNDYEFLTRHPYFVMGMHAIEHNGSYFNATDKAGMIAQMQYFADLYLASMGRAPQVSEVDSVARTHRNEAIWAYEIDDSSVVELDDGHHRASCMYAQGMTSVDVLIVGKKTTYLQNQIRECSRTTECRLAEPIYAPEVASWQVEDFATRYWATIQDFNHSNSGFEDVKSVLCITSGYGWICSNWLNLGKKVFGLFEKKRCMQIGSISYGLSRNPNFNGVDNTETECCSGLEYDTVCAELGNAKTEAAIDQQIRRCMSVVSKRSVQVAYLAIHSNFWNAPKASSRWSSLSGLKAIFDFRAISDDCNSLEQNHRSNCVVVALRRKLP